MFPKRVLRKFEPRVQGALTYFKSLADETGIPYRSLINLYLRDCAASKKMINLAWA